MSLKKSNNKTFSKVIRYHFDNSISKGSNFIFYLILLTFLFAFIMTLIQYATDTNADGNLLDKWWSSVTKILRLGEGDTWKSRLISFVFWSLSIALSGAVIGFLASKINQMVETLKKGKSDIMEVDHIIIIGWSKNILAILKELSIANENVSDAKVVIFANLDNQKMQENLSVVKDQLKNLKVITRSGDPTNPDELKIINVDEAKSVVILNDLGDSNVVLTLLSLVSFSQNKSISIIVSLNDRSHFNSINGVKGFNITPIMANEVSANVTAQVCRYRGLGVVILDFLDFDGDEIYFKPINDLVGRSYKEAALLFNKSSLIGIASDGGSIKLNPKGETVIVKDDNLIFISEDDSTIKLDRKESINIRQNINDNPYILENNAKRILFIGWSKMGMDIVNIYDQFLSSTSIVDVAYLPQLITKDDLGMELKVKINYIELNNESTDILSLLDKNKYDEVVILANKSGNDIDIEKSDISTLLKMLLIDTNRSKLVNSEFRVISQLLDSSKAKLVDSTFAEELVVSDNLAALLISQLIENSHLNAVFDELFSSLGAAINVFPIDKYVNLGEEITYEHLVYSAGLKNESAIGIRTGGESMSSQTKGVVLNPKKDLVITPSVNDSLFVISGLKE